VISLEFEFLKFQATSLSTESRWEELAHVNVTRRIRRAVNFPVLYLGNFKLLRFASVLPNWVEIRVTESCNSRCITCSSWRNSKEGELETDELLSALRQLRKIGADGIRFSGGESLTRSDLPVLVREAHWLGFPELQIATNGLLLEKKAEQLVTEARGNLRFDVSLDGIGDTDNKIRGIPDHYSRALAGIKKVKTLQKEIGREIVVNVFTTLLKQNISEVPSIVDLCDRIGARWCFSLLCGKIDLFKETPVSEFAPTDWALIDRTIEYLKRRYIENPFLLYTNLPILEYARQFLKGTVDLRDFPCTLGYTALCLGSRGEVYPGCYVNKPLGNIRENELAKILSMPRYRRFAETMYKRECCPNCTFFYEDSVMNRYRFPRLERIRKTLRSK